MYESGREEESDKTDTRGTVCHKLGLVEGSGSQNIDYSNNDNQDETSMSPESMNQHAIVDMISLRSTSPATNSMEEEREPLVLVNTAGV